MLNVAPTNRAGFSDRLSMAVDDAVRAAREAQPPRQYLGGSILGYDCKRKLAYQYFKTPLDAEAGFTGRTYRIFDMGHDGEDRVAEYLRLAGFELMTETAHGKQFGFGVWPDEDRPNGRVAGHCDGVVTGASEALLPHLAGMAFPALWENKCLKASRFAAVKKRGLRNAEPEYYVQVQVYMSRIEVLKNPDGTVNPTLWTAMNRDTGEIYYEMVKFDPRVAEDALLKGKQIIEADHPEDLPRVASEISDFRCKWCDYRERCWNRVGAEPVREAAPPPSWPSMAGSSERSAFSVAPSAAPPTQRFPWQFGG